MKYGIYQQIFGSWNEKKIGEIEANSIKSAAIKFTKSKNGNATYSVNSRFSANVRCINGTVEYFCIRFND